MVFSFSFRKIGPLCNLDQPLFHIALPISQDNGPSETIQFTFSFAGTGLSCDFMCFFRGENSAGVQKNSMDNFFDGNVIFLRLGQ